MNQMRVKNRAIRIAGAATVSDPKSFAINGMLVIGSTAIMIIQSKSVILWNLDCQEILSFIYAFSLDGISIVTKKPNNAPERTNTPCVFRTG